MPQHEPTGAVWHLNSNSTDMLTKSILTRLFLLFLFLIPLTTLAQVRLPKLISDGMVLQRNAEVNVWGWASEGENVTVRFQDKTYQATADASGNWLVEMKDLKPGGPYQMVVSGKNEIELEDVLVGDVWVASGQSNMELPMRRVAPLYEEEIKTAQNDFIRYFEVPKTYDFAVARQDLEGGEWQKITPASIPNISAVSYFFAKDLYEKYQVPIGVINSALGGSPVEAWISEEALKQFPEHYQEAQLFKNPNHIKQIENADQARIQAWYKALFQKDAGYKGDLRWSDPELNSADWASMNIPGFWADAELGPVNGVVWFRREIDVPASMAGKPADLNLGVIVDSDSAFVNGQFVGTTGYQYPPRWYKVPAGVLKEGKNVIAIRIVNERGRGGFVSEKPYALTVGDQKINLEGAWQYKLGATMEPLAGQTFIRWKPMGLYNAMISPLLNYTIKGVIWYQGESNTDAAEEYAASFPAMIKDWRNKWGQGDFPFLFVQLANFMAAKPQPSESGWAQLRESQRSTLALPNTGMAVAIDVGEWNDIHPLNKKAVGERLALAAQKVAYGDDVVYSGPSYKSIKRKGSKLVLTFKNTGSGLQAKGGELKHFAIAGPDGKYVWAEAEIKGDKVIVWSDEVAKPVAVRYAWADNPEGANLYNKEGLPASPFEAKVKQ